MLDLCCFFRIVVYVYGGVVCGLELKCLNCEFYRV